ncbi:hypothetical protein BDZ89DRAFT_746407 [Hymenopellis radicata]|nr:hypothetical protein BDZ89DRAFT_746407 [Hymenopellis radicata]
MRCIPGRPSICWVKETIKRNNTWELRAASFWASRRTGPIQRLSASIILCTMSCVSSNPWKYHAVHRHSVDLCTSYVRIRWVRRSC